MGKIDKIYAKLMAAKSDNSFSFDEIGYLLSKLGFQSKQTGSHISFRKGAAYANLQSQKGKAKGYQVAQVREELKKHQIEP